MWWSHVGSNMTVFIILLVSARSTTKTSFLVLSYFGNMVWFCVMVLPSLCTHCCPRWTGIQGRGEFNQTCGRCFELGKERKIVTQTLICTSKYPTLMDAGSDLKFGREERAQWATAYDAPFVEDERKLCFTYIEFRGRKEWRWAQHVLLNNLKLRG